MKLAPLLALLGFLALAGPSAALGPEPLLDLLYENATSLGACVAASAEGGVGLAVISDPLGVEVTTPSVTPPGPDCLVLPSP